jgi:hypothetical protein
VNDTPVVVRHSVRISRPLDVVKQELLDQELLTVALLWAAERAEGVSPHPAALDVHVCVGRWYGRHEFFAIPMAWVVSGCVPAALSGEFEMRAVSPGEVEVGLRMVSLREAPSQRHDEEEPVRPVFEVVTRSFLNCVFWTLEARSRHEGRSQTEGPRSP